MKTSELIKQVEASFLSVVDTGHNISIKNNIGEPVAIVSTSEMFRINTSYLGFGKLTDEGKITLFRLLTEYVETPVDEREPEKKYHIKLPGIVDNLNFLNYEMIQGFFFLDSITDNQEVQTIFTQSEIDNFPDDIKSLITVAERIEVVE